jgi:hypothetical protein
MNVGANVSSGIKDEATARESWWSMLDTMVMIF